LTFATAFAYIEFEQKEKICWVLEKLEKKNMEKDLFPQMILNDRDFALMKGIEVVFSNIVNLFCWFNIGKNVGAKCNITSYENYK